MRRNDRLPELLAPAGSFEHLKAAVKAGADAIYLGGRQFGARAYANNFSEEEIIEALHYAHLHDRCLYLTVNTLMKEEELTRHLHDFLSPLYLEGLDGVIVQDIGAAALIKERFPGMEIHGSTQMTITNRFGARAAARLGMSRIVPARELTIKELTDIKRETDLEMEVFVHGALCYCYSGKCLFSSMYGGRSGNRGRCAQPCRLPYQLLDGDRELRVRKKIPTREGQTHLLSLKDLCVLSEIPALIESGMDSFKIEGRMKSVEYVAGVTAIYRKYMDDYQKMKEEKRTGEWSVREEDKKSLEELYSRSGFTDGYLFGKTGTKMMSIHCPRNMGRKIGTVSAVSGHRAGICLQKGEKIQGRDVLIIPLENQRELALTVPDVVLEDKKLVWMNLPGGEHPRKGSPVYRRRNERQIQIIEKDILQKNIKYPVTGEITIEKRKKTKLMLQCKGKSVVVYGEAAEESQKKPITQEDVLRQMEKTGEVPFYLDEFQIHLGDQLFLPMSRLKKLRQEGYQKLQETLEDRRREGTKKEKESVISLNNNMRRENNSSFLESFEKMAVVYDESLLSFCLADDFFSVICLPAAFWEGKKMQKAAKEAIRLGKKVRLSLPAVIRSAHEESLRALCRSFPWDGIYVHDVGQAEFVRDCVSGKIPVRASASFYQWNRRSLETSLRLYGLSSAELPMELAGKESEAAFFREDGAPVLPVEWMVYGRTEIMRSAQCPKKTSGLCDKRSEWLWLEDREGRRMPSVSHCEFCYSSLWMDRPKDRIGEEMGAFRGKIKSYHFHFMTEEKEQIQNIIRRFSQWASGGFMGKNKNADVHWNSGIE
ncbi:MAG: U32 family peptidase [Eubacteriales bacterium]|nr:U32 family peptidase [Eubacteriales bacterium]